MNLYFNEVFCSAVENEIARKESMRNLEIPFLSPRTILARRDKLIILITIEG